MNRVGTIFVGVVVGLVLCFSSLAHAAGGAIAGSVKEVTFRGVGYRGEPKSAVKLSSETPISLDFTLQKGMVRWTDLSQYQGEKLLPEGRGRDVVLGRCMACHGFQSRIAATRQDEAGWRRDVE